MDDKELWKDTHYMFDFELRFTPDSAAAKYDWWEQRKVDLQCGYAWQDVSRAGVILKSTSVVLCTAPDSLVIRSRFDDVLEAIRDYYAEFPATLPLGFIYTTQRMVPDGDGAKREHGGGWIFATPARLYEETSAEALIQFQEKLAKKGTDT